MPQSPAFLITVLVLNLATDVCIILIPIPIIAPLKISTARKLALGVMFGGGLFTMIAAILRVYFVLTVSQLHLSVWCTIDKNKSLSKARQLPFGLVVKMSLLLSLVRPR